MWRTVSLLSGPVIWVGPEPLLRPQAFGPLSARPSALSLVPVAAVCRDSEDKGRGTVHWGWARQQALRRRPREGGALTQSHTAKGGEQIRWQLYSDSRKAFSPGPGDWNDWNGPESKRVWMQPGAAPGGTVRGASPEHFRAARGELQAQPDDSGDLCWVQQAALNPFQPSDPRDRLELAPRSASY